jgi:hypothetical protein
VSYLAASTFVNFAYANNTCTEFSLCVSRHINEVEVKLHASMVWALVKMAAQIPATCPQGNEFLILTGSEHGSHQICCSRSKAKKKKELYVYVKTV